MGSCITFKVVHFITILLVVPVVGVFWGSWLGLSRSITSFSAETFLNIGHAMIANLALVMSILMPLAVLSTAVVLFLMYRQRASRLLRDTYRIPAPGDRDSHNSSYRSPYRQSD